MWDPGFGKGPRRLLLATYFLFWKDCLEELFHFSVVTVETIGCLASACLSEMNPESLAKHL